MATRGKRAPRNGPARALLEADPEEDIRNVLARVTRYECTACGLQKFTRPQRCADCGAAEFDTVEPEGDDAE